MRYGEEGEAEGERKNKMGREGVEQEEKKRKGYRESKEQCVSFVHFPFYLLLQSFASATNHGHV